MRIPIIAGNWKMNKTKDEAVDFIYRINREVPNSAKVETVIFAQSPYLKTLVKRQGDYLQIGAQNMHYEDNGAYTGEISPVVVKSLGVTYILIGHSERKIYYNETDETVNLKLQAAFRNSLKAIVCVGESLKDREGNKTTAVITKQVESALKGITAKQVENVVLAYEPIWAIGTGKTATTSIANDTCGVIRSVIEKLYSLEVANKVRIQYGGSVKPSNIKQLMAEEQIDGVLVGGASLNSEDFLQLIYYQN